MTPCEELGYKEGDLFNYKERGYSFLQENYGDDVEMVLAWDDESTLPMFVPRDLYYEDFDYRERPSRLSSAEWNYECLDFMVKVGTLNEEYDAANTLKLMQVASEELSKFANMLDKTWPTDATISVSQSVIDRFFEFRKAMGGDNGRAALVITSKYTLEFDEYEFHGDAERVIHVMDLLEDLHGTK